MGTVLGLFFGTGLLLIWQGLTAPAERQHRTPKLIERSQALLSRAGIDNVTPVGFLSLIGLCALTALVAMSIVSQTLPIAVAFAALAGYAPITVVKGRASRRQRELVEVWPEAVDNLASAV